MEFRDYLNVLVKRGWIILLVAAITACSAYVFSTMQTVTYRSSIWLNVWPGRPDWGLQQTIKGLLRNYSGQIRSRDVAQQVINLQQLDMKVDDVLAAMTVSPIESDFLIQIDVDDIDPQRAQVVAQTAAELFVEEKQVQMLDQNKSDRVDAEYLARIGPLDPALLYPLLPYPVDYVPYTAAHVVTQLQLLMFAGLAFFVMLSQMERMLTITLDFDWFYRVLLVRVAKVVERTWAWLLELLRELRRDLRTVLGPRFEAWFLPHGRLAQTWPTGSMTLWVTVILVLLVVLAQRDTLS